ncbi:MAG: response regulator [Anaerolineales bacterium]|nr:response regulator [Anaerolineales bacterium]
MANPVVLVADDDIAMLQFMVRRLEKQGLQIHQAADGREALEKLEKLRFDLVVSDIYMPGVTGLELLQQAKEGDPQTQVIIVTAGATLENAVEALNNGAFAYLVKPFDHFSVFDNVVARALQFRQALLDNERLAKIQQRRGDMLEEEVTDRVVQLQRRRRELLDLLAGLPDGVLVVEPGGRVVISNPIADIWLAKDRSDPDQPIHKYLESLHEEWASSKWEIDLGGTSLELNMRPLPKTTTAERKVVVIRELGEKEEQQPILDLPWKEIEGSLAWLMGRPMDRAVSAQIKALQDLFSDLKIKVGGPGVHISGFAAKWSELTIPDSSGTEDTEGEVNSAESNEVSVEEDLKGEGAASKESPLRKER